uniref:Nicotinate phosphoribosyltransferase n=2 Tax=Geotrypetes seraphini TaxID=260995 RepID=A0A6P8PPR7_GEOSA|nr:nicotinate phosphoribosyltransferase isoform X1 [Geotrypetes seraphini]
MARAVPPLLTDLYQFTMAYGYWKGGRQREPAEFELFFREPPFRGGFTLFFGLHECLLFLRGFGFGGEDIEYLESVLPSSVEKAFFDFLRTVDASEVTLSSVPEGSVVFAKVPLLKVRGPLLVVQLLETTLLCLVNYASLVATNAARFREAAGPDKKLLELGLRRAQGPNGGLSASKYSYMGGFDYTSNALAGKLCGIPVAGTVAHSYVTSFSSLEEVSPRTLRPANGKDPTVDIISLAKAWLARVCSLFQVPINQVNCGELAAFISYSIAFPHNFLVLVDTYSVMRSGIPNFCAVALALQELGFRALGIRLDSGNLAKQSVEIRCIFRSCAAHFGIPWFENLSIAVSNNISEQSLLELTAQENEINVIGVGTNLVTCLTQPSLGCVYKLVQVKRCPRMKVSEDPEKMTLPGSKKVYRVFDSSDHPVLDLMALEEEPPLQVGQEVESFVLGTNKMEKVTAGAVEVLHRVYFRDGQICERLPSIATIRSHAQTSLKKLSPIHRRLHEPQPYKVAVTEKLHLLIDSLRTNNHLQ